MPTDPTTIYSNVINIRTTAAELVFEFGNRFPSGNEPAGEFSPEIRVVMPILAVQTLAQVLGEAAQRMKSASTHTESEHGSQEPPTARAK